MPLGHSKPMEAAVIDQYGDPDVLHIAKVDAPRPRPHEVLIRVRAAGVNPIDWRIRSGSLRFLLPGRFPLILGYDVSGTVVEIGKEVHTLAPGEDVFCFLDGRRHGGGYAEFAVASERVVVPKPAMLTLEEAAAVPLAAMTALRALRDHGAIRRGSEVLINGASGGVGTFAVQLAATFESNVTGVCSGSNVDFVRHLGAQRVIDYTRDDFTQDDARYDIIFDAVAKSSYRRCRPLLKRGGTYVTTLPSVESFVFHSLPRAVSPKSCRVVMVRPSGSNLRRIKELIDQQKVRPILDKTFPLTEAAEAHRLSEKGHVRGKLVLNLG